MGQSSHGAPPVQAPRLWIRRELPDAFVPKPLSCPAELPAPLWDGGARARLHASGARAGAGDCEAAVPT